MSFFFIKKLLRDTKFIVVNLLEVFPQGVS